MKILITGAGGFLGHTSVQLFRDQGFEVHAVYKTQKKESPPGVYAHYCDLLNTHQTEQLVRHLSPHYLLHCAWYVEHAKFWSALQNIPFIAATASLYHAFGVNGGKKAILIGTSAEYSSSASLCYEDKTEIKPNTLYGLAKKQTFDLIKQLHVQFQLPEFCWLRLFNLFGKKEHHERLVPLIFNSFLNNSSLFLQNPHAIRNFSSINYVAEIALNLLNKNLSGIFNVGSQHNLSILEMARFIHQRYFKNHDFRIEYSSSAEENQFLPDLCKIYAHNLQNRKSLAEDLDPIFEFWKSG